MFNPDDEMFLSIYRDVVLLLEERNFLFDDDPELLAVRQSREFQPDFPITQTTPVIEGIPLPAEEVITNVQGSTFAPISIKQDPQTAMEDDPEVVGFHFFFSPFSQYFKTIICFPLHNQIHV